MIASGDNPRTLDTPVMHYLRGRSPLVIRPERDGRSAAICLGQLIVSFRLEVPRQLRQALLVAKFTERHNARVAALAVGPNDNAVGHHQSAMPLVSIP